MSPRRNRGASGVSPTPDDLELAEFFRLSLDLLCVAGTDGYFKRLNPAWERTLGWTEADLLGRPYIEFVHPDDREATLAAAQQLAGGEHVLSFENRYRCKDGSYRWLLWKSTVRPERGLVYAVARDITDRKEREQAAQDRAGRSERLYRQVFEHAPIGICRSTPDGRLLSANPALVRLLGYQSEDELRAHRMPEFYARAEDRERVVEALEGTGVLTGAEFEWRRRGGSRLWVQLDAVAVPGPAGRYYQAFVRDVTQRKTLEAQFLQAQKMEAVGRLAGGVAHDFNNLLTVMIGSTDLLLEQVGSESPLQDDLQEIKRAGERAAALSRQLLALSRKQLVQPVVLDLNEVVADLEKMLRRLIGEHIELIASLSAQPAWVKADRGQLEQVLLNLVVNARDAMPQGGKLLVATSRVELDRHYAAEHAEVTPGRYVLLSVSDTGHGMDEATQRQIFEPFFTTKEKGKGTGLGLSTVYGIVKQSGGHIWVYSEPGSGTTFKVYLPLVETLEPAGLAPEGAKPVARSSGTVLLVEDDAAIRRVARRALERAGFAVLEAAHAEQALGACQAHRGEIALLLTDVVLPGMSGVELTEQVRRRRPQCRVLYMSGYTDDAMAYHRVLEAGIRFVEKPFTAEELVRRVRQALAEAP